ncbi:NAD-glutamate dehydrogenase [Calidifontibacter sp. DB0510]|uniref:NAD-glutamate dehydrogenase n=1 Tax=Metallococcus carri TaxID=1656884 RepID=A0A967AY12_9MICO|nr:NAD-glutamate dehydrogenase [Metallococcus carri]NHN54532.1 NAD-glutamate dehydrogenase [Metallococcus carri]NOP36629.1 NAD-glutamate dehydrogenase [Calidifontibacter sp. DB2511S]
MSVDSRQDILRECAALDREAPGGVDGLLERYFRHVADDDLAATGPENLRGMLASHRALAQHRPPGRANIQVLRPTEAKDGWTSSFTVLQIVTDDMPFLVDSVTAELARRDRNVHLLIHPQLWVRRDATGELQEVLDVEGTPGRDGGLAPIAESWMHLAIDLAADEAQDDELVTALREVLEDVRNAVTDWARMRAQCDRLIDDLEQHPPASVPSGIVERTQGFLRWLADEHFTFLGYREYALDQVDGEDVLRGVAGTGLGLLRYDAPESQSFSRLTPQARATARDPQLLTITKANSRSTVHRPVFLDYIGIRSFDADGKVTGEHRFLGLFSSTAYVESVRRVPVVRERAAKVLEAAGFTPDSHSYKDLLEVLETYPRDELFQCPSAQIAKVAQTILRLQERRQSHVFRRDDEFGRFASVLVFLPRDRYNTQVRLEMEGVLRSVYEGASVDYTTRVTDSPLARIHFVVRMPQGQPLPDVDDAELSRRLLGTTRTWGEQMRDVARDEDGDDAAARVVSLYADSFSTSYKEDFSARQAVADLRHVEALSDDSDTRLTLYRDGNDTSERRFKLFRTDPVTLTDILPIFTDLGVQVTDERPYAVTRSDGRAVHIYDFGLRAPSSRAWGEGQVAEDVRERFQDAFAAVWDGRAESDGLNALVLRAGLHWREVALLRALARYLRQVGLAFSQEYVEESLVANVDLTTALVRLWQARHDPRLAGDRQAEQDKWNARIDAGLADVASLDQDRIIRYFRGAILATLRTNDFTRTADGAHPEALAVKIDCAKVPGMPYPRPKFEIWVYSPQVEGVHLRFGKVARGGLRWSDRREDFRTEVLGLVKAQMVKNAVIVPTGSKGGFYAKQLPDPSDREAWMAAGIAAYKMFIGGLLSVTDNLVDGEVVPPRDVVRHDEDDTYLVVAADKGTATFSDIANGVAQDHEFWLDDAFASGGSAGYDHKAMGITARGAWESVKRHFREMGHDTQTEDFTVVGVGDMSGDVFGNGMLLSEHIRLVAAFDHRHIFLDPEPEAASSYAERRRLFDLPRSSWADYDTGLISDGGGVYPRSAKSVSITPQVRAALGLDDDVTALTPNELIHAILLAPVDLFWNGGIGTYVKASTEHDAQVGDRANDGIRVDGNQLRVKVIGEGGNLGATQLGRIEAALQGVRVNTDAIDNSAGVDTSDHEVNIKILLTGLMRSGRFDLDQRNELLQSMTDEVAEQVLRDNYEQNTLLGNARAQTHVMLPVHQRLIQRLEERGELNRALEFLPTDAEMAERAKAGGGLTSPEFSVLVAYAKLWLKAQLTATSLPDDEWFASTLRDYFPRQIRELYADELAEHPLRREIVVNAVVNSMVNRGGITFAFRAQEETGASAERITRAFVIAREVFGMTDYMRAVEALDHQVSTEAQTMLYLEFRRLVDRTSRWLLHNRPGHLDIGTEIARFAPVVAELGPRIPDLLQGTERERWERRRADLVAAGIPQELAGRAAALLDTYSLLDIAEQAAATGTAPAEVAEVYFAVSERLGIDRMLNAVSKLPRDDRWDSLARGAVRDDLYAVLESFTAGVLASASSGGSAKERLQAWEQANPEAVERAAGALRSVLSLDRPGLAPISVALRTLRGVVRSGSAQ